ncbi:VWA domain-containing protein [Streptomyces kanasensis]|uniref:VWA domain-containing protein n=1 Tax=Streptomyces kanasensis TaxID=936756 RepID=UPI0036FADB59
MRTTSTGRAGRAAALFLSLGLVALTPAPTPAPALAPAAAASTPAAPAGDADPLDFAVVVDQSESLSAADLAREVEAAALLVQGEISQRSRATVIGFGSSEEPGQSPVREVCPPTVADTAGRQRLSDCVQQLSRRDPARTGPGTDFPAAIRQAVDRLTERGDAATPRVVFLLTDGRLDVADSPEYGKDRTSRQANGAKRLTDALARARREKVQIWPLGFGSGIDRAALTAMARGGYQPGCADTSAATPRMRVVADSAGIDEAFQETFAAARCAGVSPGDSKRPPADLYVTIPPVATDGTITVTKHDPAVTVTYYDPRGRRVSAGTDLDGSRFELSGQDGPVEALRVSDPLPGRWRAHVEAPAEHRNREVAVRAIWQGRLGSEVLLDPASPRPGEETVVQVRMQTRRGVVITDPALLAGIKVTAQLAGDGFPPVRVALADDGEGPDATASDVRFTGTVTVPATATGALRLTTLMAAPGVTSDRRPLHARVSHGTPDVVAGLTVERVTVHPGDSVRGTLSVTNNARTPRTLRLALADQAPGTQLRLDPATVTAAPNSRRDVPFTLTVGEDTAPGDLGGQITVADTGDTARVLDTAFLDVRVDAPPTWWERWWRVVVGAAAAALLLGAFVAVRLLARRRRRDLAGVELELLGGGRSLDRLSVRGGQAQGGVFRFTVEQARGAAPTLQRARPGASRSHQLHRTGGGELRLRPHGGREQTLRPGEAAPLGDDEGLEVAVHDRRSAGGTARTAPYRRGGDTHRTAAGAGGFLGRLRPARDPAGRAGVPRQRGDDPGDPRDGHGGGTWSRPGRDRGTAPEDGDRGSRTDSTDSTWDPHF